MVSVTQFFHVSTLSHRRRNKIFALKNSNNSWLYEECQIKDVIVSYFKDLFTSSRISENLFPQTTLTFPTINNTSSFWPTSLPKSKTIFPSLSKSPKSPILAVISFIIDPTEPPTVSLWKKFISNLMVERANYCLELATPLSLKLSMPLFPLTLCHGSNSVIRKIHAISWDTVTKPKNFGALGIRQSNFVNRVAMVKLGWRLQCDKVALWVKVLGAKYNNPNLRTNRASLTMRGIQKGNSIIKKETKILLRNGLTTSFWLHNWSALVFLGILFLVHSLRTKIL
ncbi:hypothetical protein ACSBR1_023577 [Camellia fascicularis]